MLRPASKSPASNVAAATVDIVGEQPCASDNASLTSSDSVRDNVNTSPLHSAQRLVASGRNSDESVGHNHQINLNNTNLATRHRQRSLNSELSQIAQDQRTALLASLHALDELQPSSTSNFNTSDPLLSTPLWEEPLPKTPNSNHVLPTADISSAIATSSSATTAAMNDKKQSASLFSPSVRKFVAPWKSSQVNTSKTRSNTSLDVHRNEDGEDIRHTRSDRDRYTSALLLPSQINNLVDRPFSNSSSAAAFKDSDDTNLLNSETPFSYPRHNSVSALLKMSASKVDKALTGRRVSNSLSGKTRRGSSASSSNQHSPFAVSSLNALSEVYHPSINQHTSNNTTLHDKQLPNVMKTLEDMIKKPPTTLSDNRKSGSIMQSDSQIVKAHIIAEDDLTDNKQIDATQSANKRPQSAPVKPTYTHLRNEITVSQESIKSQPVLQLHESNDLSIHSNSSPIPSAIATPIRTFTLSQEKALEVVAAVVAQSRLHQRICLLAKSGENVSTSISSAPELPSSVVISECHCVQKGSCPHHNVGNNNALINRLSRNQSLNSHLVRLHGPHDVRKAQPKVSPLLMHKANGSYPSTIGSNSSKSLKLQVSVHNSDDVKQGSGLINSISFLSRAILRNEVSEHQMHSRVSLAASGIGSVSASNHAKSQVTSIPSLFARDANPKIQSKKISVSNLLSIAEPSISSGDATHFEHDVEEQYKIYYYYQHRATFEVILKLLMCIFAGWYLWSAGSRDTKFHIIAGTGPVVGLLFNAFVLIWSNLQLDDSSFMLHNTLVGIMLGCVITWINILRRLCVFEIYTDGVIQLYHLVFLGVNYWVLRLQLKNRIAIGWLFSALQVIIDAMQQCDSHNTMASAIIFISVNMLGVYFSYMVEAHTRKAFLRMRKMYKHQHTLQLVQTQSEELLKLVLPKNTIEDLKSKAIRHDNAVISENDTFQNLERVTIMFADIVGFTEFSSKVSAWKLVSVLGELFAEMDNEAEALNLVKIKTIGDCYQCCGGIPDGVKDEVQAADYAEKMIRLSMHIIRIVEKMSRKINYPLRVRVGVHTGSVIFGVVGYLRIKYDVWSDHVDIASLMEQTATQGVPHISEMTYQLIKSQPRFAFSSARNVDFSGQSIKTYNVVQCREVIVRSSESQFSVGVMPYTVPDTFNAGENQSIEDEDTNDISLEKRHNIFQSLNGRGEVILDDANTLRNSIQEQLSLFEQFNQEISSFGTFKDSIVEEQYKNDYLEQYGETLIASFCVLLVIPIALLAVISIGKISPFAAIVPLGGCLAILSFSTFIMWRLFVLQRAKVSRMANTSTSAFQNVDEGIDRQIGSQDKVDPSDKWKSWWPNVLAISALLFIAVTFFARILWTTIPKNKPRYRASYYHACDILLLYACTLFIGLRGRYFIGLVFIFKFASDLMFFFRLYLEAGYLPTLDTTIVPWQFSSVIITLVASLANHSVDRLMRQNFQMKRHISSNWAMVKNVEQQNIRLLNLIFPPDVLARMRSTPTHTFAEAYDDASIIFIYITGFYSAEIAPIMGLKLMNELINEIDDLCESCGVTKIKTIGPKYLAMTKDGVHAQLAEPHYIRIANFAMRLKTVIDNYNQQFYLMFFQNVSVRIGISCGPVVTGVIGTTNFAYDVWGDTVNVASRMESNGVNSTVHTSEIVFLKLKHAYNFESRGKMFIKGKGEMDTYFLLSPKLYFQEEI